MAVYPGGVKVFTSKRNALDDVDATHINTIQSELVAVQSALGPSPFFEQELPGARRVDYGSVAKRLRAVQKGYDKPFVTMVKSSQSIKHGTDTYISFTTNIDPYHWGNSSGVTTKQAGVYTIHAGLQWAGNTRGYRLLILEIGGSEMERDMRFASAITTRAIGTNAHYTGYIAANQSIRVKVSQTTGKSWAASAVRLTLMWQRNLDLPGTGQ